MALSFILMLVAGLILLTVPALLLHGAALGRILVYGGSLLFTGAALMITLVALLGGSPTETLVLPVGLPWIGAHFRLDALSAFFLVVVNLGAAMASLYGIGYGRREKAPSGCSPSTRCSLPA